MSSIIKLKKNNSTYVYEAVSYRDKEGKTKRKKRYLGKLDKDGSLISTKTKLPAQITEVKTVRKKFVLKNK